MAPDELESVTLPLTPPFVKGGDKGVGDWQLPFPKIIEEEAANSYFFLTLLFALPK